jgi:tRNA modification GTPase
MMVNIDVSIDYPEYDVEEVQNKEISQTLESVEKKLIKLEKSFDNGKIIKEGIKTVIIGKPNAGKSSLLNTILKEERAIVTEVEGTTRDTIEEFVNINGIPLKIIDTAGIREATDTVEKIGIEKSKEIAQESDLIIAIIDASKPLEIEDREVLELAKNKNSIVVLNKIDKETKINKDDKEIKETTENVIEISALKKQGIDELYNKIVEMYSLEKINLDNEVTITNVRHKNAISKAIANTRKAKETLESSMPIDIIAIYIKDILADLGTITGDEVTEDIINEIFAKFCLGK